MAHTHPVIDGDNHFIIDPITRSVTNAESKKTILMQNDHNSERFTFEIDKLVEGHDMAKCNKIEVHYTNEDSNKKNKNAGVYEVTDMQVSTDNADKLIFSWLVSENATLYAGSLKFLVVFSCVEKGEVTYRWNTNVNTSITISKGMNNGEAVEGSYPDVLAQWKEQLFAAMYGMETTHVGPTEPETYPYIWFDTSQYVGSNEPYIGVLTVKDVHGDKRVLYPFTKLEGTDAANIGVVLDKQQKEIDNIKKELDEKVDESVVANNLTTTDSGYVLDARQGKALKDAVDGKFPKTGGTLTGDLKIDDGTNTYHELGIKRTYSNDFGNLYMTITTVGDSAPIGVVGFTTSGGSQAQMRMYNDHVTLTRQLDIAGGGTGANNAAAARKNLGAVGMSATRIILPATWWNTDNGTVSCYIPVSDLLESDNVIISPDGVYAPQYNEYQVVCTAQHDGALTFTAHSGSKPTTDMYVNVLRLREG